MSTYYVAGLPCSNELYHHGILGQKWGVRRYQNPDGSLTSAGRARYGSSGSSAKDSAKRAIKSAGRAVGKAARSATSYTATRAKMRHPSMMSDEDLRKYTQRLIAEKNYSDLLRYQNANSGIGKAKQYVGDILKRGGTTLANAGFQKMANAILKTKDQRALEALKADVERQNYLDQLESHELTKQVNMLSKQNQISDLQEKLADSDGKQAQQKEIEKLQREKQLNDLRNTLDSANIDMQKKINDLQQQKQIRDLEKQLNPNQNGAGLAAAMQIMANPDAYSTAEFNEAKKILQDYSAATSFIKNIDKNGYGNVLNPNQPVDSTGQIDKTELASAPAASNPIPDTYSPQMPRQYTPNTETRYNSGSNYSNYRMNSIDGTDGGMYGGRLRDYQLGGTESDGLYGGRLNDYRMPSSESNPYRAPARASEREGYRSPVPQSSAPVSSPDYDDYTDEDWRRMLGHSDM